jgi:hypothetical protein
MNGFAMTSAAALNMGSVSAWRGRENTMSTAEAAL